MPTCEIAERQKEMNSKIPRRIFISLTIVSLLMVSCTPTVTEEQESVTEQEEEVPLAPKKEVVASDEEVVTEKEEELVSVQEEEEVATEEELVSVQEEEVAAEEELVSVQEEEVAAEEELVSVQEEEVATEEEGSTSLTERDYRQDMRDFVQGISAYAKGINSNFIIIPQNGHELLIENGEENGIPAVAYLEAIDGVGREDLFYGYDDDDVATPISERGHMISFMDIAETNGIEVLVTDYCWTQSFVDHSYEQNAARGYISFAADHRALDNIPAYPIDPYNVHTSDITSLTEAKNFLYLIDPGSFPNKDRFLSIVRETDYDIGIIDLFYDDIALTTEEVSSLKIKANGGSRLVIAYMSIGEAEDYRYYWQAGWETASPSWLVEENPEWAGNYKVRYWDKNWQNVIYGNDDSYLKKIFNAGFDGVYLDIIDAYEYFEDQ